MADELGAVRRTPRPTGDRQTPETVAQLPRGATNAPTPVSTDAGNGTDDLRASLVELIDVSHDAAQGWHPWNFGHAAEAIIRAGWRPPRQDPAGLAELRAKLAEDPDYDYAELPDCTACEGTGKDTNGSPFEAPLAVHFAGPPVKAEGRRRQLCMWCGHVLEDVPVNSGDAAWPAWPVGFLVRIDGVRHGFPYDGGELPPGCCALPDDEKPTPGIGCYPPADGWDGVSTADVPVDPDDGYPVDLCGKHTGNCSNRCLLPAHHAGECDDDPGPDEAQETRAAADWPAEPVDTPAEGDHV